MITSKSLQVDLANPENIIEKLTEAEAVLEKIRREFEEKRDELAHWHRLVAWMQALARADAAGQAVVPSPSGQHLTELQALVVEVVNRETRRIRARDVTDILQAEGHDISGDTVSNTLWYVAEKVDPKPIQRAGRGFYAPLTYKGDEMAREAAAGILAGIGAGALAAGAHSLLEGSG